MIHWYILSDQFVKKLDANSYSTSLTGYKYKLAHKRADHDKWSITEKGQRKRLIKFLQDMIAELEKNPARETVKEKVTPKKITGKAVRKNLKRVPEEEALAEA